MRTRPPVVSSCSLLAARRSLLAEKSLILADERQRKRIGIERLGVVALAFLRRSRQTRESSKRGRVVIASREHVFVLLASEFEFAAIFIQPRQAKLGAVQQRDVRCVLTAR